MREEVGGLNAREFAIARVQFVDKFNGSTISGDQRRDHEILYMKNAYRQFLEAIGDS
jgi:hypothetical protein